MKDAARREAIEPDDVEIALRRAGLHVPDAELEQLKEGAELLAPLLARLRKADRPASFTFLSLFRPTGVARRDDG